MTNFLSFFCTFLLEPGCLSKKQSLSLRLGHTSGGLLLVCPGLGQPVAVEVGGSAHPPRCHCTCAEALHMRLSTRRPISEQVATGFESHYWDMPTSFIQQSTWNGLFYPSHHSTQPLKLQDLPIYSVSGYEDPKKKCVFVHFRPSWNLYSTFFYFYIPQKLVFH